MYETHVKKIANWLNQKIDLLGERIPEAWEQTGFEWAVGALVTLLPETFKSFPYKSMLLDYVVDWIDGDAEVSTRKMEEVRAFLDVNQRKAA